MKTNQNDGWFPVTHPKDINKFALMDKTGDYFVGFTGGIMSFKSREHISKFKKHEGYDTYILLNS